LTPIPTTVAAAWDLLPVLSTISVIIALASPGKPAFSPLRQAAVTPGMVCWTRRSRWASPCCTTKVRCIGRI